LWRERADHVAVFKLVEAAAGGGEDHDRNAGVAEDEQLHVTAEAGGIPLVILAIHLVDHLDWRFGLTAVFDTVTVTAVKKVKEVRPMAKAGRRKASLDLEPGVEPEAAFPLAGLACAGRCCRRRLRMSGCRCIAAFGAGFCRIARDLIVYLPPGYEAEPIALLSRALSE
jgi:hypothetical protein